MLWFRRKIAIHANPKKINTVTIKHTITKTIKHTITKTIKHTITKTTKHTITKTMTVYSLYATN